MAKQQTNKKYVAKPREEAPAPVDAATAELLHDPIVVGLPIPGLTPGRMVHWVFKEGEHRPAIVTSIADGSWGLVNMVVFMDGPNDGYSPSQCCNWQTAPFDPAGAVNTWHFIERV
jgi:hypothetical protein